MRYSRYLHCGDTISIGSREDGVDLVGVTDDRRAVYLAVTRLSDNGIYLE